MRSKVRGLRAIEREVLQLRRPIATAAPAVAPAATTPPGESPAVVPAATAIPAIQLAAPLSVSTKLFYGG
jgi:hypothetical protein